MKAYNAQLINTTFIDAYLTQQVHFFTETAFVGSLATES